MTMRERMLRLVRGQEIDRVPFVQYSGLAAPDEEVWRLVGRESMGIIRWSAVHRFEHPHCRFESEPFERDGRRGERTTLLTPAGTLVEERRFEPAYGSAARCKHFIRVEYPDLVEECCSLIADIHRRTYRVVRDVLERIPIPFVDVPDNITAPAIGVENFRRYCVPLYDELADMLAEWVVPVFVHMDGDLKPLWKWIAASKVRGFDSLSPPPDNDTSVADALALREDMRLFVNFPSSVHLQPPETIYAETMVILEQGGRTGRLQIQISENPPPDRWRVSFPQIVKAIRDFSNGH